MSAVAETIKAALPNGSSKEGGTIDEGVLKMTYMPQMQQEYKPPLIANENAFLGDVASR